MEVFQMRKKIVDHPRGCGENVNPVEVHCNAIGSPPRMRGKRICGSQSARKSGITPADAGKTNAWMS